jgi:putative salt-induced outer membrane protein
MSKRVCFLLLTALTTGTFVMSAYADSNWNDLNADVAAASKVAVKEGWQGSMSLGYLHTTGNSNTVSLNTKAIAGYKSGNWQDSLSLTALNASQDNQRTAETYEGNGQSNYSLDDNDYVFAMGDYLSDRFSGYDRRTTEAFGYGRRLVNSDSQQLGIELGAGARQTRFTDQTGKHNVIERLAVNYLWQFSDHSNFSENLSAEHGIDNTFTQSVTALTANLAGNFALSVSYTVKHNTTVLPGFKNTDTITAISLVYSF